MRLKDTHIFDNAAYASLGLILRMGCNKHFLFLLLLRPIVLTGMEGQEAERWGKSKYFLFSSQHKSQAF